MKNNRIKENLEPILPVLSFSVIAEKYFGKSRQWLFQKINESVINDAKYKFNDNEIEILIAALKDINKDISNSINSLSKIQSQNNKQKAKYYTKDNPFNHVLFREWLSFIPNYQNKRFLEPFAGGNNIVSLVLRVDNKIINWNCFDIIPPIVNNVPEFSIVKRDTIKNFPRGFDVCITNPPYLAKNSATRRKLKYPDTYYDDVYKLCLDIMLSNCSFVAAIIPESFVTTNLFHNKLFGVISLNTKIFNDTNCPVCLALFIPNKSDNDFGVYVGDEYIGKYNNLKQYDLSNNKIKSKINWIFNDPNGSIGIKCVDSQNKADIHFHRGELIDPNKIKVSSRAFTRISGLPDNIDIDEFIDRCNKELEEYRTNTKDIFLTSFKGLRKDGKYRRRIDFQTVRCILNKALFIYHPTET